MSTMITCRRFNRPWFATSETKIPNGGEMSEVKWFCKSLARWDAEAVAPKMYEVTCFFFFSSSSLSFGLRFLSSYCRFSFWISCSSAFLSFFLSSFVYFRGFLIFCRFLFSFISFFSVGSFRFIFFVVSLLSSFFILICLCRFVFFFLVFC